MRGWRRPRVARISTPVNLLGLLVTTTLGALCAPAIAAPALHGDRFRTVYEPPKNPAHQELYVDLKSARTLEKFREFLSIIRLPHVLILKLAGCGGADDAWYEPQDRTITVCYEYLEKIRSIAPKVTTPDGVTPIDAVRGPVLEVFLHEVGHALFDQLHIPILGHEEDAADQFAAFLLLHLDEKTARSTVLGVAWMYAQEAKDAEIGKDDLADAHSLSGQRYYTLQCLAYGAEPQLFADLVSKHYLPEERAETCEDEYHQVAYAIHTLMGRYIDVGRRDKVFAEQWLGGRVRKKTSTESGSQ
jgi:Putative metallopeptidase